MAVGKSRPAPYPWSFSKLKSFRQCPKQFHAEKVLRLYPFKETEATLYGTEFHEAAENYVRDGEPMPKQFNYAKDAIDKLQEKPGEKLCEYKLGLNGDLEACDFDAEDVWFRGIVDLLIVDRENSLAWVIDYKTGRNSRWADKGQLELMALATFKHFPEIKKIRAGLLFVVANELVKDTYTVFDQTELWKKWLGYYSEMEVAFDKDVWNPNPSGLCRKHCPVLECPHNGQS